MKGSPSIRKANDINGEDIEITDNVGGFHWNFLLTFLSSTELTRIIKFLCMVSYIKNELQRIGSYDIKTV